MSEKAPSPVKLGGHPLLGKLKVFADNPVKIFEEAEATGARLCSFRVAHLKFHYASTLEGVQHVMQKNHHNYIKGGHVAAIGRRLLGNGLVFSEGEFWRRQRRIANPAFHKACLEHYTTAMQKAAQVMINDIEAAPNGVIDVSPAFYTYALHVVRDSLFGVADIHDRVQPIIDNIVTLLEEAEKRIKTAMDLPLWIPLPSNRRIAKVVKQNANIINELINEKKKQEEPGNTLLDMLIHTPDPETGQSMTHRHLMDEVHIFFVAGTETSANALNWMAWLLAAHKDVQKRCREEITAVLGQEEPTFDHLQQMPYLTRVMNECLRHRGPSWFAMRTTQAPDVIDGVPVPKNSKIFMSEYMLHHNPKYWHEPEKFDPDRFLEENADKNNTKAFIPFTIGPRKCVGWRFAITEMALLLCQLLRRYEFNEAEGFKPEMEFRAMMGPKEGMLIQFSPINQQVPIAIDNN